MMKKVIWMTVMTLSVMHLNAYAQPLTSTPVNAAVSQPVNPASQPVRTVELLFSKLLPSPSPIILRSLTQENAQIEFGVRSDDIVSQATLNLDFTPSPSLIPTASQLKVYLNDELMGVVPITQEQLGHANRIKMPIDPRYIIAFNRLRISFIGHYKAACEDPTDSTLWTDISKSSSLSLTIQTLPMKNDLTYFPKPFFDGKDNQPLILPIVFAEKPDLLQQKSAAILASWFGTKSKWLDQSFPVLFNELPQTNAIVYATNTKRPSFLQNHPMVNAPTIEMIDHPTNPYIKLLLVLGRDDNDLLIASKGIAQGNVLFRGQKVTVDKVEQLAQRKPYDAPNWIRTDTPTTFAQLQQYKEQLETKGITPYPVSLSFNIPPDLYMQQAKGVDMRLNYRFTAPSSSNRSLLNISLNDHFIHSYELNTNANKDPTIFEPSSLESLFNSDKTLVLPASALNPNNNLAFDFNYSLSLKSDLNHCERNIITPNYAVIDPNSSIDLSGFYHYFAMPNLHSFTQSGYPFSRLADLSETLILVNKNSNAAQISTLLNVVGIIGSKTGYPVISMRISDDWADAQTKDVDILMIGSMPPEFKDNDKMNLLIEATKSWIKEPLRYHESVLSYENTKPDSKVTIGSAREIAAIVGVQSPFFKQRSIVAFLANSPQSFELLNNTLTDSKKLGSVFGSVAVIRDSGIVSMQVGDIYYVGHIPWWMLAWYSLQTHPILLAIGIALTAVFVGFLLWRALTIFSQRRLRRDDLD